MPGAHPVTGMPARMTHAIGRSPLIQPPVRAQRTTTRPTRQVRSSSRVSICVRDCYTCLATASTRFPLPLLPRIIYPRHSRNPRPGTCGSSGRRVLPSFQRRSGFLTGLCGRGARNPWAPLRMNRRHPCTDSPETPPVVSGPRCGRNIRLGSS